MIEHALKILHTIPPDLMFVGVIGLLLICGLGLPMPEEIPLFLAGYLVAEGGAELWMACVATVLAILIGDSVLFYVGYRYGQGIFNIKPFNKLLNKKHMRKVNFYVHRFGSRVVFIGRFLAGLRGPIFLTTGILRMPYRKFIFFDGLAALISAPTSVWLSYYFFTHFQDIASALSMVQQAEKLIIVGVVLFFLVLLYLTLKAFRERSTKKKKKLLAKQLRETDLRR